MEKCISDNLLLQYLVNELDADTCELVRVHLNECPSCQKRTEIYSDDSELKQWQKNYQQGQNGDDSRSHPFSQAKLDRLFNSTVSSIQLLKTPVTKSILPSDHRSSIILGNGLEQTPIKVIGQYQLIKKIGQGGMGVVYQSIHSHLKKQVVLKLLLDKGWDSTNQTQRFYREMELVGQLDHPNIVKATDAGEADDTCFLVMEYLDGHDLKTILKAEGPLSITASCSIVRQAANGLQYIHNHDLIHRDIKPSNLFLTTDGQVKILDLGLAGLRHTDSSFDDDLTDTNCIMGSAHYMAPEQAQSIKEIDQRSDIYSLGCTLYQLLTGHVPFKRETPVETIIAHREDSAPYLSEHLPEIPEELEELFQSMVKKDPDDRIQTMAEVVKVLDKFLINKSEIPLNETSDTFYTESQELKQLCLNTILTHPVEARKHYSSTQFQPTQRTPKRIKTIIIASTTLLLITCVTLGFLYISKPDYRPDAPAGDTNSSPQPQLPSETLSERDVAIWALKLGCEISIVFPNRDIRPIPTNLDTLPNQDFYVSRITFPETMIITHEILSHLADLKKVEKLTMFECTIEDDALDAIKHLTSLNKLDLHRTGTDLHQTGITDKGLSHISRLINLTNLSLQNNQNITDEGLQILNHFQNLKSVNLAKTNISDKGLKFIQNNPNIDWLNIQATNVSDESVKYFIKLQFLRELFLDGSKISEDGIEQIRQSFGKNDPIQP